jgi:hypothetical protein
LQHLSLNNLIERPPSFRSIILVDNAAQLIIHRRCEDLVRRDRKDASPKLKAAQRKTVLGHWFAEKVKFLELMAAISGAERHFIGELHSYRNMLYHAGLKHDDIIRPLAISYYQLTCELLVRLDNKSIDWPDNLVIAHTLHPYFPDAAAGRRFPGYDVKHVSRQLVERTPTDAPPLAAALASHSKTFVALVEAQFERIKLGLDKKSVPTEAFRQLQHAADFRTLARERMRKNGKEDMYIPFGHPALREFAVKLMPNWKPRYTSPPFAKWLARSKALGTAPEQLSAVRRFADLRSEMEYLAEAIEDAHDEFWGRVQQQEDAAQDAR